MHIAQSANPARLHPPSDAESIPAGIAEMGGFLPNVFGIEPAAERGAQMREAMEKYTRRLRRLRQ
ncbi:MAG: hypothetical protein M3Y62_07885 [Candidatus Dormibacteraeota bacterium]|nr:hypothetical protein [Candidatus Dormibacteraeota bacterium]